MDIKRFFLEHENYIYTLLSLLNKSTNVKAKKNFESKRKSKQVTKKHKINVTI